MLLRLLHEMQAVVQRRDLGDDDPAVAVGVAGSQDLLEQHLRLQGLQRAVASRDDVLPLRRLAGRRLGGGLRQLQLLKRLLELLLLLSRKGASVQLRLPRGCIGIAAPAQPEPSIINVTRHSPDRQQAK